MSNPAQIQPNYVSSPITYIPPVPKQEPQVPFDNGVILKEQANAISYDIAAEYAATDKLLHILTDAAKEAKDEKDPQRKKILEARVSTVNNMLEQREAKIEQMTNMAKYNENMAKAAAQGVNQPQLPRCC